MDLRRLRHFVVVGEELSIRKAAKRLGITQSALTKQMTSLEAKLGFDLLIRDRQRIVGLTPSGAHFLEDARRVTAEIDRAANSARAIALGKAGTLRLGLSEDATTALLSQILAAFRLRLPDVGLELFELSSTGLVRGVKEGQFDIALVASAVDDGYVVVHPLWRDAWLVALPAGDQLAGLETITCEDLASRPLILADPELASSGHEQIRKAFRDSDITPVGVIPALRRTTMLYLVGAGAGVTFLPGSLAAISTPGVVMRPFRAESMTVAAVYRDDPPGLAMQFLRIAHAAIGDHGDTIDPGPRRSS